VDRKGFFWIIVSQSGSTLSTRLSASWIACGTCLTVKSAMLFFGSAWTAVE
jgi:hypothetical protein